MITYEILHEPSKKSGKVTWDPKTNKLTVDLDDENLKPIIENYLSSVQEFWIPESDRLDDYRVDREVPIKEETYFRLAMSALWSKTGVLVIYK